jgi:hypothetical protein
LMNGEGAPQFARRSRFARGVDAARFEGSPPVGPPRGGEMTDLAEERR